MTKFTLNGQPFRFEGDPATPLLWVLRDNAGLKGTKYGCGAGLCGACTVHVNGRARRSCTTTVNAVAGGEVRTIEGLAGEQLHPVQQAWIDEDVAQCGYCQAGQIMTAADWLQRVPEPTDEDIEKYQTNLCRCGTYARVRRAIKSAASLSKSASTTINEWTPGEEKA